MTCGKAGTVSEEGFLEEVVFKPEALGPGRRWGDSCWLRAQQAQSWGERKRLGG